MWPKNVIAGCGGRDAIYAGSGNNPIYVDMKADIATAVIAVKSAKTL